MERKLQKLILQKTIILSLKVFMRTNKFQDDTVNNSDLQKVFIYSIYPKDSKICSDKRFVNIDNRILGGTHWKAFYVENNNSYYFDSFGAQPYQFLLSQLPEPNIYHN